MRLKYSNLFVAATIAVFLMIVIALSSPQVFDVYEQSGQTGSTITVSSSLCSTAVASKLPIYFRKNTTFVITGSENQFDDYTSLIGDGPTSVIKINSSYTGGTTTAVFRSIGHGNISLRDLTIAGNYNDKHIANVFAFNSKGANDSTKCTGFTFLRVNFEYLWADATVKMGNAVEGETHSNDGVIFSYCKWKNIYNPSYPILHSETEAYHMNISCDAIDNAQTTLGETVDHCTFDSISGRAGAGYGWGLTSTDTIAPNPKYMNWTWTNNNFRHCFKFLEFNGGALGRNITVTGNYGFDWTSDNGVAVSLVGYKTICKNNQWEGFDRKAEELYGIEGDFDDMITVRPYTAGCGGTPRSSSFQQNFVELGGYNHHINGVWVYEGYPSNTTQRLSGLFLTGKNITGDHQPSFWNGQSNAGGITSDNLTIRGINGPAISAESQPFDNVTFKKLYVQSSVLKETMIQQQGDRWNFGEITANLWGSPDGTTTRGIYGMQTLQSTTTPTSTVIEKITIYQQTYNSWKLLNKQLYSWKQPLYLTYNPN